MVNSHLNADDVLSGYLLQGSGIMIGVLLAGKWPGGGDERKNGDQYRKDGQLCYYLLLLYICLHFTSISK